MHELSLVLGIVKTSEEIARKNNAQGVEEVQLEIGTMAGVEIQAFNFAWREATKNTLLDGALLVVDTVEARARCMDCDTEFSILHYYTPCPQCGGHLIHVYIGKDLKIKSILVS